MFSPHDPDGVLAEFGDKFLIAFAGSVTGARADIADLREFRPGWFPGMHPRCLANLIHDRIWNHLVVLVEDLPDAFPVDKGINREMQVGSHLLIRIKRHADDDRISTYPTQAAINFYLPQAALPGLERITLAIGYRWNEDERAIGAPVISYREGKDNPIWAVELDEPEQGTTSIGWHPLPSPDLPTVTMGDLTAEDEAGEVEGP